jgi:hypothetical protein
MGEASAPDRFFDLNQFDLSDMIELGGALRQAGKSWSSMEQAADSIVHFLYSHLAQRESGKRNCALVRFFKTHAYSDLEPGLQEFAREAAGGEISAQTRCLTLLATAGARAEWNTRLQSTGHKAIPLLSEEVVRQEPMVAQLIQQFGLEISQVLHPDPALMLDLEQRNYNVFHVPEALGSPFVPAQDFVRANGIRSVLGFGGLFPTAELFAVIMFARVPVPRQTAEMFRTLALGVKLAVLPFVGGQVFASQSVA